MTLRPSTHTKSSSGADAVICITCIHFTHILCVFTATFGFDKIITRISIFNIYKSPQMQKLPKSKIFYFFLFILHIFKINTFDKKFTATFFFDILYSLLLGFL
jgi:hypothetical protein